jgi:hypothetical protein
MFLSIGRARWIESREIDMSLLEASKFRVTVRPNQPTVSVLYKPTQRRYTNTAVADETERSRCGVLASGFCVDRGGTKLADFVRTENQLGQLSGFQQVSRRSVGHGRDGEDAVKVLEAFTKDT